MKTFINWYSNLKLFLDSKELEELNKVEIALLIQGRFQGSKNKYINKEKLNLTKFININFHIKFNEEIKFQRNTSTINIEDSYNNNSVTPRNITKRKESNDKEDNNKRKFPIERDDIPKWDNPIRIYKKRALN
ncbi:hypothetical protein H8356DRAFT_1339129 [Neocallimastix lanati (nom. inval.)]|nr:hypothetical protein H8356DRAFT_1339129 [Neocallimastix sp. JGI-2020a]